MPSGALTPAQMLQAQTQASPQPSQSASPPAPQTSSVPQGALTPTQMTMAQSQAQSSPTPRGLFPALVNDTVGAGKWLGSAFKAGIEQPAVSVAATPVQLLAKAAGLPDPFSANNVFSPQKSLGVDVAPVTPSGMFQKLGQATSLGLLALSPEAKGIFGLTALGAGQGAASSVGVGNTDLGQIGNDAWKGLLFGGTLGILGKVADLWIAGSKAATGIDPATETELARIRPSTLATYQNTAIESAKDFHAPSVDTVLGQDIQKGANILTSKIIPDAGTAVGDARKAAGNVLISLVDLTTGMAANGVEAVTGLRDNINNVLQEMTGHQFSDYATGEDNGGLTITNYPEGPSMQGITSTEGSVTPLPGRALEISNSDQKALESIDTQLKTLQNSPTVQTASDIMKNLDSKIDWNRPQYGEGSSPVDAALRYARGAINRTIAPVAPDLAKANAIWGDLQDVKSAVADAAGKDLNHINLLARRVAYRGEEGKAQSVLGQLYDAVKPELPPGEESYVTKAIIARYARDVFGGARSISGLTQSMSTGDVAGVAGGFPSRVVGAALRYGQKVIAPDPYQYAMSIAKGEPYSFVPFFHHIDEFLDTPSGNTILQGLKTAAKDAGVSSNNAGIVATKTLKAMLITHLTTPSSIPVQQPQPTPQQPVSMAPSGNQKTLSVAQPTAKALTATTPATSGQQYSVQARSLSDFGMNMRPTSGFRLS